MHGSRVSVGWPSTGEVQRPESASTGHGRAARVGQNLARPASAPVLHLDLHRFAPSVTTKPRQAAVPPAAPFERLSRPQSASVKHKTPSGLLSPTSAQLATLGFTSDAEKRLHRAAKQRALEQEAGGSATDAVWRVENCALARAQLATASRFVSPQSRHDIAKHMSRVPLSSMSRIAWSKHTITRHLGHTMKGPRAPTESPQSPH